MKERIIKNWIATVFGLIMGLVGVVAWWYGKINSLGLIPVALLSWAFITGKNTLLNGMTANILKLK